MVTFPGNVTLSSLGLGTWRMGESPGRRKREVAAVRAALDIGWRVIDTAEMYGDGGAEEVVGEAVGGALRAGALARENLFVVSKVYPHNATARGVVAACERSLGRLGLDHLDCYLLHWRGSVPLAETVAAFEGLRERGRIRHWGVSNFDVDDMDELLRVPAGENCAANQVLYNVTRRGPEFDLIPWMTEHRMPLMAYSPIEQGRLPRGGVLQRIGQKYGASPFQIALAWLLQKPDVIAIPKASSPDHVRDNHRALEIRLSPEDLDAIDAEFPTPRRKRPLEMI